MKIYDKLNLMITEYKTNNIVTETNDTNPTLYFDSSLSGISQAISDKQMLIEKKIVISNIKQSKHKKNITLKESGFTLAEIDILQNINNIDFNVVGLSNSDILAEAFSDDSEIDILQNKEMMAIVINELISEYKNKLKFLKAVIMESKPSIISMYNTITRLAKEKGYKTIQDTLDKNNNVELDFINQWGI